ncbi:transcriptional regulator [Beggiatoa leptomitoformis]|uniref:Helix-turn-helix domain-containing protein n=1 Tax=Beggiatoa leptomitoformis TaxID=288004 RepID=A0A2N9YIF7_9GAMM|nr:transcriptional regulator [Beggiatoa leptomitoformis]ALG67475.1 helix-turn-helix domain-containing protein [Beggiatoa leptomitoformis]AUI70308.1 helix-turn-helix domain-containing protein [Beggiatoa leptomitoformis]
MTADKQTGRYAYDGLDRIMHEKARLGILTSLLTQKEGILFNDLKVLCTLTDGNLSRHLKALEEEGLVNLDKSFQNNRPQTLCYLTPTGRQRFLAYIQELERVIKDTELAAKQLTNENGDSIVA